MVDFVAMLSHRKGEPGNGYRPQAGTRCLVSGPNCDNESGYTYIEAEILWRDDLFVVYRAPGCWPNVCKWEHILAKPVEHATPPPAPAVEQGAIVADVAREAGVKVGEVLKFLRSALAMNATVNQRISHDIAGCVVEHFRTQPEARGVEGMVDRFLCWKLPDDFAPDAGISFTPNEIQSPGNLHWPVGTSLLTAAQARAMFEHCLATPNPVRAEQPEGKEANWLAERIAKWQETYPDSESSWVDKSDAAVEILEEYGDLICQLASSPAAPGAAVGVDATRYRIFRDWWFKYWTLVNYEDEVSSATTSDELDAAIDALAGKEGA